MGTNEIEIKPVDNAGADKSARQPKRARSVARPRRPVAVDGAAPGGQQAAEDDPRAAARERRALRLRLKSIGTLLRSMTAALEGVDPALARRQSYLMLLGVLVQAMTARAEELPTPMLVQLAKLLGDPAAARRTRAGGGDATGEPPDGETAARPPGLPPEFPDIVRQIYGVGIDPAPRDQAAPSAPESLAQTRN